MSPCCPPPAPSLALPKPKKAKLSANNRDPIEAWRKQPIQGPFEPTGAGHRVPARSRTKGVRAGDIQRKRKKITARFLGAETPAKVSAPGTGGDS